MDDLMIKSPALKIFQHPLFWILIQTLILIDPIYWLFSQWMVQINNNKKIHVWQKRLVNEFLYDFYNLYTVNILRQLNFILINKVYLQSMKLISVYELYAKTYIYNGVGSLPVEVFVVGYDYNFYYENWNYVVVVRARTMPTIP